MKITVIPLITALIFLDSCINQQPARPTTAPKTQVTVTKLTRGYLPDYIQMTGKTIYLNKTGITSPINGYVTKVNIRQGDKVKKGDLLYEIQTPEAYIMDNNSGSANHYGIIKIYAPVNGRVINLNSVNRGLFVNKGDVLCKLLASNDLMLQVNVPVEYVNFTGAGKKCKVILPDDKVIEGLFTKELAQMDEKSQTIKVLAQLNTTGFFPENMITKVLVDRSVKHMAQIAPKTCLQTNALMTRFWIMKLINDTTAIQVFVKIGNQTHRQVEILSPLFKPGDLFINQGAYGLSDTVLINVAEPND